MLKRLIGRSQPPTPPLSSGRSSSQPSDLTDDGFDAAVDSPVLTIVDFWAEWCQPCTVMSAFTEILAREFGEQIRVLALDVDENPHSADRFGVLGLPTLIFFRNGTEIDRTTGVSGYDELRRHTEVLLRAGPDDSRAEAP